MIKRVLKYLISPGFIIPLIVFVIAKIFSVVVSKSANCPGFGELCWSRWDSGLYMQIAETGRDLIPCANPGEWCGKAGWMPLYPWLMRIGHWLTGLSLPTVGIWISSLCFFFLLLVTGKLINIKKHNVPAYLGLLLCAFAPGNIYYHAIFPMSLLALLISLVFLFIVKKQYAMASLFAGLAILSYSIGFLLIASLLGFVLFEKIILKNKSKLIYALVLVPTLFFVGLLFHDAIVFKHWDAMFLIQYKYGHAVQNPFLILKQTFQLYQQKSSELEAWKYIQNIFLFFYFLVISVLFGLLSLKNKNSITGLIAFCSLFFWFVPFSLGTNVGLYRNISSMGFLHPLIHKWNNVIGIVLLAVFLVFSWYLGQLFTYSTLI